MNKEIIAFGDNKTEKQNFHRYKHYISLKNLDIDYISISKYCIGYMDNNYKITA